MQPRRIEILESFRIAVRSLPELTDAIAEAVKHFVARSNENALQVEKLTKGMWSFRVDRGNRAFFDQAKDAHGNAVSRLFHVGPHDDYRTAHRKQPAAPPPPKKKKGKKKAGRAKK